MFCRKCGTEISSNARFCKVCGEKLIVEEGDINIIFSRKKQFYGMFISIKVYLDDSLVGSVGSGGKLKVVTSTGKHKIRFSLWSGNEAYDIDIPNNVKDVKVTFKLEMGLLTSKPKIVDITNT